MSSPATPGSSPSSSRPRFLKALLVISLAANFLFVGLIAGSVWKHTYGKSHLTKHRAFEATIEQVMKELPEAKRATAENVLVRLRSDVFPKADEMREARRAVVEALLADPYEEEAMRKALLDLTTLRSDVSRGMHDLSLELIREMTLEERKRLLEIFKSKRRGSRRWAHQ